MRVTWATDIALPAGTNEIGKLAAGVAEIGNVKNSGTFVVQEDGAALTSLQLLDNAVSGAGYNITQMGGVNLNMNTGVRATGTQRVTIATNDLVPITIASAQVKSGAFASGALASGSVASGAFASGSIAAGAIASGAASIAAAEDDASANLDVGVKIMARRTATPADTSGTDLDYEMVQMDNGRVWTSATIDAALPAGTNAIGKLSANSGVDIGDVDVTSISAGSTLIGDVGISGARTSGGTTSYKNIDVDAKDEVKATAGQVYWIHAMNTTAAPVFLKFYDSAAGDVTVGTTVPDHTFLVPANADSDGAGFTLAIPNGIEFGTGITIAGTGLVADNDNTALSANALIVNLGFA